MSKWLRRGDRVVVIAGNDKGKSGKVLRRQNNRVVIEGVNIRKKHLRRTEQYPQGIIATFEAPLHISNVCPCDGNGSAVRLRIQEGAEGRELVYRDGDKSVVYRSISRAK